MYTLILRNLIFISMSYILFLSPFLYGMDNIYDFTLKQVILFNSTLDDTHIIHRKLAMLNSEYNAIIEKDYRSEKKYIEQLMQKNGTPLVHEKISWNKNFTECAWVNIQQNSNDIQNLEFIVAGLLDKQLLIKSDRWPYFMFFAAGDKARPIFNEKGDASIVIYADFEMTDDPSVVYEGFLKYVIDVNGNSRSKRCLIEVGNEDKVFKFDKKSLIEVRRKSEVFEFNLVLNLPQLLQAILQSTNVSQRKVEDEGDVVELYNIDGVTFPDNYKDFAKHSIFGFINHASYNELPFCLKEAIDKQYQKQCEAIKNEWLLKRNLMYHKALLQNKKTEISEKI